MAGMMAPTLSRKGTEGPSLSSVSASSGIRQIMRPDVQAFNVVRVVNSNTQCPKNTAGAYRLFFKMLMFKYSCCQHSTNVWESLIMHQVLGFNKISKYFEAYFLCGTTRLTVDPPSSGESNKA